MIELPMSGKPDVLPPEHMLRGSHYWLLNTSGGKDSQTAMRRAVEVADQVGVDRRRLVAVHADLGMMEWPGAKELAADHAKRYGLRFVVTKARNKEGAEPSLLESIEKRGMWPDSVNRYCTSDFKRGPIRRVITMLQREAGCYCTFLNVMGMRADESPKRSKMLPFYRDDKASSKNRGVYVWLPIHGWTARQVWGDIHQSGVPYHRVYDMGMPRLSCKFCVFAPFEALVIAGREDPALLREYVGVQRRTGHLFRHKFDLESVLRAVEAGDETGRVSDWEM